MVACRYYAQGNCKFGDSCRFEHIDPPSSGDGDPFSSSASNGRPPKPNGAGGGEEPVWPFCALANADPKTGNRLPGDMSPEEIRLQAYRAPERAAAAEAALLAEHQARLAGAGVGPPAGQPAAPQDPFAGTTAPASQFPGNPQAVGDPFAPGFGAPQQMAPQQNSMFDAAPAPTPFAQPAQPLPNAFAPPAQPFVAPSQQAPAAPATHIPAAAEGQFAAMNFGFQKVPEMPPPAKFL